MCISINGLIRKNHIFQIFLQIIPFNSVFKTKRISLFKCWFLLCHVKSYRKHHYVIWKSVLNFPEYIISVHKYALIRNIKCEMYYDFFHSNMF